MLDAITGMAVAHRTVRREIKRALRVRQLETRLHHGVVSPEFACQAAKLEHQPVGILEVDRLRPRMIDYFSHFHALADQFVALLAQSRFVARLESEMVESAGYAEAARD